MTLKRFGVSLEDNILEDLDDFVKDNNFANRSQAIRFLVEKSVVEKKWMCDHIVTGVVIIIYDPEMKDIDAKISEIETAIKESILSSMRYFPKEGCCLHVTSLIGKAHCLTELSDKLISIKGIRHGKLLMSRAD